MRRWRKDLTFIGLMGMIDPARPEVKEAVRVAHGAGLKSVMVTGDYKDTAEAVAKEIGLLGAGGRVLTGAELDKMSDAELAAIIDEVDACCRVSPQHKTKIVDAFKAKGHVVAMTGDGVNDAPALKRANIGVAMGITGTDVSKETADMVLTDDNFASIISAVEEGRIIYSNIRKFVFFLVACNIGEILIIFLSMLTGLPMPLRPIQLLLLNLVTDGAPALALGLEKGEPDIMKRPPRPDQGTGHQPGHADQHRVHRRGGHNRRAGRLRPGPLPLPGEPHRGPNDGLRDAGLLGAPAGLHLPFGDLFHFLDRRFLQPVDGSGHRFLFPDAAPGHLCSFPAAVRGHGSVKPGRLAGQCCPSCSSLPRPLKSSKFSYGGRRTGWRPRLLWPSPIRPTGWSRGAKVTRVIAVLERGRID